MNNQEPKTASRIGASGIMFSLVVCVVLTAALSYAHGSERGATSDYSSVMAAGVSAQAYKLEGRFFLSLVPQVLTGGLLILFGARLIYLLSRNRARRIGHPLLRSQDGSSAVQFILTFPFLLIIILLILQIALIVQAKFVINYAAFCAARSAIVTIPARVGSRRFTENRNEIQLNNSESPKMKIIQRSAALPCVGISPRQSPGLIAHTGTLGDFAAAAHLLPLSLFVPYTHANYIAQMGLRAPYAYDRKNTKIEITPNTRQFTDHAEITVKVTHRYYLVVPFADRLLGQSYIGGSWFGFNSAKYLEINEQYTLLNEGEPPYPESQRERFRDSDLEIENY